METATPDSDWIHLQTYASQEEAAPLLALLSENGISYDLVQDVHQPGDGLNFDLENRGPDVVHVQVFPKDLERAQRVLEVLAGEVQSELEDSDYLNSFSDAELFDVLKNFDEWNQVDYVLAARLLVQRGHALDDAQLTMWRSERMRVLETPQKAGASYLTGAYVMAVLGGVFGLFMGLQLRTHVKRLPDGRKVHGYTEADRAQGTVIMAISLITLAIMAYTLVSLRR